jgi:hypothetical protein
MQERNNRYFYLALLIGLMLHGATLLFTFEGTYDAFVHLFFANHYAENWFESWNYQWYTGFTVTSYPPLVHQVIALLSKVVGLKAGFLIWSFFIILVFIRGVYTFSKIWVGERAAAYAAILAVFSTAFGEALHIFGQLPSITGVAFLLNACPELYWWLRKDQRYRLFTGLSLLAMTSTAHHVTTIFGMVFFVMPTLGLAVMNRCAEKKAGEQNVHFKDIIREVFRVLPRVIVFGLTVIAITAIVIFPYWYWSKSDPITQVPIPHGSRDSFIEVMSSGMVFFLIPWGMMLFFLPYLFREIVRKRNIFIGLSISLAFLLGTGGTTPLPRMMLGETAFNILTLDRFTYWASLLSLPFWGAFFYELLEGRYKKFLQDKLGYFFRFLLTGGLCFGVLVSALAVINFQNFRATQPDKIDVLPIVNFLERDKHDDWRYLTLGFGDQVAWLSTNTTALSVDGNYHSVRRLPEMTTRAVERLENAKYLGMEGILSLQQFLTSPEKYNLKFIFSNDKFYDPILFFYGWKKLQQLENNIIIWERNDVPGLASVLPRKNIPDIQRLMWGIIPISVLILGLLINLWFGLKYYKKQSIEQQSLLGYAAQKTHKIFWGGYTAWIVGFALFIGASSIYFTYKNHDHTTPTNLIESYFHRLDFKNFRKAYTYFNPDTRPSLEQYLMELSVEGGILSSYAKLDTIDISFDPGDQPDKLTATVTANWLTSLNSYKTTHQIELTQKGIFWYIEPFELEKRTPPDKFIRRPSVDFLSHGKRKTIADKVEKRDILDRPDVYIVAASLVEKAGDFAVVGQIINTDNDPSFLAIEVAFYDANGQELARNNVQDLVSHVLYPKETTAFKVDFDPFGHQKLSTKDNLSTRIPKPHHFAVFVRSLVAGESFYKHTGVQAIQLDDQGVLNGEIVNFGARQIIVPQLLFSYYNSAKQLLWVETHYLQGGIRSQRKKAFKHSIPDYQNIKILKDGNDDNLRINGVSRSMYRDNQDIPVNPDLYPTTAFQLKDSLLINIGISAQMASQSDE